MAQKTMYIVRGLPGSGKTTLARRIAEKVFAADDFFYELGGGTYDFDPKRLGEAHAACQVNTEAALMSAIESVAVANTFTQSWEAEPYYKMAEKHGYSVFVIECQSDFGNVHDVPPEAIEKMAARWERKLRRPDG